VQIRVRSASRPKRGRVIATIASTLLLLNMGCAKKAHGGRGAAVSDASNGDALIRRPQQQTAAPAASAPSDAVSAGVVEPHAAMPTTEIPAGTYVATLIEAGVATYSSLEIGADGILRGKPFGPWESMVGEDVPTAQRGSLSVDSRCSAVEPPPIPTANPDNRVHVLSRPKICAKLQLLPRDATQVSLQWHGYEQNHREIAVLQPTAVTQSPWMLVLADIQLSPAGPWLEVRTNDLDGDGMRDIAFVAEGVDGCDRGPCPLFWIELLLSHTHTLVRSSTEAHQQGQDAFVLLNVEEFEKRLGLNYMDFSPSKLTWRSHVAKNRYEVSLHTGKRTLTWTAIIGADEIMVTKLW